jgi:DNA-binding response OmpR family regulator
MESFPILVVEDDKDINQLIAYNLQKKGFTVEQAFDGQAAREKLDGRFFPIVILDIMLPGIDGFDICRQIKSDEKKCKSYVIIISAKSSAQDKLYAHILGADCYITKPFSIETLVGVSEELRGLVEKEFTVEQSG